MRLTDAWEYFGGYPMFESLGAFGFGRGDEGIGAGLVDEDSLGTCSWNHSPESGYWFYLHHLHEQIFAFVWIDKTPCLSTSPLTLTIITNDKSLKADAKNDQ